MRIWIISELSILPTTMAKKSAHLYWYKDGFSVNHWAMLFTIGCGGNIGTAGDTCNINVCWALSFALLAHIICCVPWLNSSKRVNMSHRRDQIFPMCTKGETGCTLSNNMFLRDKSTPYYLVWARAKYLFSRHLSTAALFGLQVDDPDVQLKA